jgi:hypothetical protein
VAGEYKAMTNVWLAPGLTVAAGLATGVGSALAFFAKRTNYRFLSVSTGFSAGVMLYVSFVEISYKRMVSTTEPTHDQKTTVAGRRLLHDHDPPEDGIGRRRDRGGVGVDAPEELDLLQYRDAEVPSSQNVVRLGPGRWFPYWRCARYRAYAPCRTRRANSW